MAEGHWACAKLSFVYSVKARARVEDSQDIIEEFMLHDKDILVPSTLS